MILSSCHCVHILGGLAHQQTHCCCGTAPAVLVPLLVCVVFQKGVFWGCNCGGVCEWLCVRALLIQWLVWIHGPLRHMMVFLLLILLLHVHSLFLCDCSVALPVYVANFFSSHSLMDSLSFFLVVSCNENQCVCGDSVASNTVYLHVQHGKGW